MSTGTNRERLEQNNTLLEDIKIQIQNLPEAGGSGDVKQFATIEEMQADKTAKEGDLAIVYRSEVQNVTVDSKFQVATFPDTVVLDTTLTDGIEVRYRAVDSSVMLECMGQLNSSSFMMDCYTETGNIRIQYTSSDGITYTRTDTTGNPVDFGTEIYYYRPERWNDVIGKFIQVGGSTFKGLYQNTKYVDTNSLVFVPINNISLTVDNGLTNVTFNGQYDNIEYDISQIGALLNTIKSDTNGSTVTLYQDNDNTLHAICTPSNQYYSCLLLAVYDTNGAFIGIGVTDKSSFTCKQYILDLINNTITFEKNITTVLSSHYLGYYYLPLTNIKSFPARYSFDSPANTIVNEDILGFVNGTSSQSYYTVLSNVKHNLEKIEYKIAPTQLTTAPDYVYEKEFYGKNGIEIGTLQNKENLTKDGVKRRVDIWANYSSGIVCPSNLSSMFRGRTDLTSIPLLDTSSVTDMDSMFYGCTNLTTIPLLDTSSVTNMHFMFADCANLTTIPELNTSKVTNMGYMFRHCTNLTTIPELNTSKVTDMAYMFYGCTNLTTVPLLDISSVTYMSFMFANCTSLSEESLNNILAMCINATSYTTNTKTLKQLGLTSEQATKCTTLSNYSAFTAAGWTTGY